MHFKIALFNTENREKFVFVKHIENL